MKYRITLTIDAQFKSDSEASKHLDVLIQKIDRDIDAVCPEVYVGECWILKLIDGYKIRSDAESRSWSRYDTPMSKKVTFPFFRDDLEDAPKVGK